MGNSRAQTEHAQVKAPRIQLYDDDKRLTFQAPEKNDHADNDDEQVTGRTESKKRDQRAPANSRRRRRDPTDITDRTTRDPSPQDEKGQDSSVLLQAALASAGGSAAASAGGVVHFGHSKVVCLVQTNQEFMLDT